MNHFLFFRCTESDLHFASLHLIDKLMWFDLLNVLGNQHIFSVRRFWQEIRCLKCFKEKFLFFLPKIKLMKFCKAGICRDDIALQERELQGKTPFFYPYLNQIHL
ncbi:hypothetical protein BpHYR1_022404 [Brachionus plicatilis]|uniref:Uncharacterized protein n=1 Tax=Brachionus plicatilis TaxID=10195 RepID=A0A3M7R2D7_BRAPC|nr:hypothetical protein BpHYR1_022404 [Brachionus plicatilis]